MSVRPRLTLERTFRAPIREVWELWTTREGIEAWWGPDGFSVAVREIDIRPGGNLRYTMTATGAEQVDYMVKAGMPITTQNSKRYVEVEPPRRLVFKERADFIPGVEPYEVETVVELTDLGDSTRMVLNFEAMHDERWTQLATAGREMELAKLERLLAGRA